MDKYQGVFDSGMSGIFDEGDRKTMPDFIDKLAQEEAGNEPEVENVETLQLGFGKETGLTRAVEISSRESRTLENKKVETKDFRKEIESEVTDLLSSGANPKAIQKSLERKFPRSQVKKYFEANSLAILKKYASIASSFFESRSYKVSKEIEDALRDHRQRLTKEPAIDVVASFVDWSEKLKRLQQRTDPEDKVSFKRDIDQKAMKERNIENNVEKNAYHREIQELESVYADFKSHVNDGLTKKEAHSQLVQRYSVNVLESFYKRYAKRIEKTLKAISSNTFDTDFKGVHNTSKTKDASELSNRSNYDEKKMLTMAFQMMTAGKKLPEIKDALKKGFKLENVQAFLRDNTKKLEKHYGQLGYVFIDANMYGSCDKMAKAYGDLGFIGRNLMISVKARKSCKGCVSNREGVCEKTGLMVSNHPLVRSPRAARRIFEKAASFAPKAYVEEYVSKLSPDGNMQLVSEFTLGLKKACDEEKRNIGKTAKVKEDPNSIDSQIGFDTPASHGVELFKDSVNSKIIDDVIEGH